MCHLWNLVAEETREGDVYLTLLKKLEEARKALGGQVFDVLGKLQFEGKPLRELLIEAIRYGERPEVKAHLNRVVEDAFDKNKLQEILDEKSLAHDVMDISRVMRVREEMEQAEARRLQRIILNLSLLKLLSSWADQSNKGAETLRSTRVPAIIRQRDRQIGIGEPVLTRYERVV